MSKEVARYLKTTERIETSDIDWEAARQIGLTEEERFVLTYFSDIESQTIRYLRSLLQMKIALQPDVAAFLTTWNYEEFFHGYELARLLEVCGHPLETERVEQVKRTSHLSERLEMWLTPLFSKLFANQFPAVYFAFGAIQELTTLRGYEHLKNYTRNPALKVLCERIAKQERRHFAWYFNHAREQLQQVRGAGWLARKLMEWFWVPVGAGVKTAEEVNRLFGLLFPGENGHQLVREIDARMDTLPGLGGLRLMETFFARNGALA